jgi:MFS family permease
MSTCTPKRPLLTFDFISLCLLVFFTYCNTTVYYSFYTHLQRIGVPSEWRGLLVGANSLATALLFLVASHHLTTRNAVRNVRLGVGLLFVCGAAYLVTNGVSGLLAVRLLHGVGVGLILASSMTLLVASIPPERSGQAFGLYSLATLMPYLVVPSGFDWLNSKLSSFAYGYLAMAVFLLPALLIIYVINRRLKQHPESIRHSVAVSFKEMLVDAGKPSTFLLLLVNLVYYLSFAALFFLSKGLFHARGMDNVGAFFSLQMLCMMSVRVLAARIFDIYPKICLIRISYMLCALGAGLLYVTSGLWALYVAAVCIGFGMGVGAPALNSFMFEISEQKYRSVNSNLMLMSLWLGNFSGPFLGNAAIVLFGEDGFLLVSMASLGLGILLSLYYSKPGRRPSRPGSVTECGPHAS